MSKRVYEQAFARLTRVIRQRIGTDRSPQRSTLPRAVVGICRLDPLEARRLLAVHPAPQLGTINFNPPSYTIPAGAYWVSAESNAAVLSTNRNSPGELKYTLDHAPPSSTVILREGTYRKQHNLTRRLTIQNEPGKRVIFKGSDPVTSWTQAGTNLWYTRWDTKLTGTQPNSTNPAFPESIDFDQVFRNGTALAQTWDNPTTPEVEGRANNAFGSGKFWIGTVAGQQRVYVADNPTIATMEVSRRNNNFNFGQGSSGSVLRGIIFAHSGTQGMSISAPNITVERCLFAWNANFGLGVYGTNVALRDNMFVSNGHNGISGTFGGTRNSGIVERNYFAHNNAEAFNNSWNAAAIKLTRGKDLKIYNNIFEYNYTNGIWADVHANNVQIVGNISRHNTDFGIFFESSHEATIAFNVVHDNRLSGILIADASGAKVWNNTVVNNGKGITVKDGRRFNKEALTEGDPGSPINFQPEELINGSWEIVRDTVIRNNIISRSRQYQLDFSEWVFAGEQDPDPATTINPDTGEQKWTDAEIPEGTSITLPNGTVIYNPRPLRHLGSRSLFYSGGGNTSSWTARANAVNSNVFHVSPAISGLNAGPVAWLNTKAASSKVVYTPAQFASNTDQSVRFRPLGSSQPLFNDAPAKDYRLRPDSVVVAWGESLPTAIRNAAADAGIVINDPSRPNAGALPTVGGATDKRELGSQLTSWTPNSTLLAVQSGRSAAQFRISTTGGTRQTVGGLITNANDDPGGLIRVTQSSMTALGWPFSEVAIVPSSRPAELLGDSVRSDNSVADELILVRFG